MRTSEKLCVGFLFDDTLDSNDGVAQYVKNLGAWLSGQGHHVFYLSGQTSLKTWAGGPVYSPSKNIGVNFNGNQVRTPLPAGRGHIKEILAKQKPDVLHVQVPYSPFMAGRVVSSVGPNVAVIGTFHIYPSGTATTLGVRLLRLFCLKTLKRFDQMLAVSRPAAVFARRTMGINSELSSNVVELERFKTASANPISNHIVFLGRLVKRKGAEELLRAYFMLKEKVPDSSLTIAGDGPERGKLERLVKQRGLGDSVKFLGYISEKDKPNILASAAVACFPSTGGESFGIVLIEAMAAGAGVVIGGNNPGYTSVLGQQPETLFDPNATTELAEQLSKLLNNPGLANTIHERQRRVVRKYDVEVVGPQILQLYKQAIVKRTQTGHNKS